MLNNIYQGLRIQSNRVSPHAVQQCAVFDGQFAINHLSFTKKIGRYQFKKYSVIADRSREIKFIPIQA